MDSMRLTLILIGISVLHPRMGALEQLDEPALWGPSSALQGSFVEFFCEIPGKPAALSVLYELYVKANPGKIIGEYSSLSGEFATFSQLITQHHDGQLVCKASENNQTSMESSFSAALDFRVIVPVKDASIIPNTNIEKIWEGQALSLQCTASEGTDVSYEWFRNNAPVQTPYDRNQGALTFHRVSAEDSGNYLCVASNEFNQTTVYNSSSDVTVSISEYVSKPELSFDVKKLDDGDYKAIVTCQSRKGTPPYTFSLLNYTDLIATETTEANRVSFNMSIELNRDMGQVMCNASNEGNWVLSERKSLTVETVGGAVTMTHYKHIDLDFQVVGVVLHCKVERGSFPHYSWFLNDSRLLGRGQFYAVAWTDDSVLALSVGQTSAGVYHCQASDRFDNSSSIRGPKMLISKHALNTVPALVVVVVFSSFALLNVAVMSCCIYGVVLRRRYPRTYPKMRIADKQGDEEEEDEDYLFEMLENYEEDVVRAHRLSDSADDEELSMDETVLYDGPDPFNRIH